ncbi:zinc finger and SCAN domain-containing protein 21-like isoform X4 [Oncorhynchus mykiss]|uniref:zinc finger and SCAN domain-containing protein 21-like isoform X4 n=1 Tax=Oncorhynchus mykiss TaxID=8022 RepID=UPI00187759CF|nr:zinc finger and SCAN domain-containing protein 21-like isoform X4 [Oncorhynchus mykiss]
MSGSVVEFQAQIASIMEVLANAAVAEICKVVDDGYAVVHLKMSQSHKENEFLRRKMKLMELQITRFRAERTKFSEGSVHNRFHGIRLLNRHNHREITTTGPTWQSRNRLSNRSFGNSSIQRDRQPIDVDEEDVSPSKHMDATNDEQSAETEEGEPDLLIIKDEGEADDQDSRISHPDRTVEGSREPTTQPAADPAFQPRGNNINTAMEQTEEGEPDLLIIKVEGEADDQDSRISHPARTVEGSRELITQPAAATTEESAFQLSGPRGNNNYNTAMEVSGSDVVLGFSPKSYHSSSEHVIVIDSVSSGQQVDRDFEWGQVGTSTTPQVNGSGNKQGVGVFNRNAPSIHPVHHKSMRDNTMQLVSPGFRPTEINTSTRLDAGNTGEANKASLRSLASLHRHSEIPGRGAQQPAHTSLPVGHFRPSATTSSHSSNLANHIRPGTIERPYGCPSCHKKFVHESDLRQHVVIHTRKRVFACTLCEKSFVSPSKLQVHQNVHTGEKPFSCAQCGRRFSQSSNLNRHQKLHH